MTEAVCDSVFAPEARGKKLDDNVIIEGVSGLQDGAVWSAFVVEVMPENGVACLELLRTVENKPVTEVRWLNRKVLGSKQVQFVGEQTIT